MRSHARALAAPIAALAGLVVLVFAFVAPPVGAHSDSHHPSGKDRTVEPGGSGTQGKSPSAPDQDGRGPERDVGGTDKPGGPGGHNRADQDGNNGCGNDQDFEDDNEGLCLGRQGRRPGGPPTTTPPTTTPPTTTPPTTTPPTTTPPTTTPTTTPGTTPTTTPGTTPTTTPTTIGGGVQSPPPDQETQVLGEQVERRPQPVAQPAPAPEVPVLGAQVERQPQAAAAAPAEVARDELAVTGTTDLLLVIAGTSLLAGAALLGARDRLAARTR